MNFFFDRQPLAALEEAVDRYKRAEFESPTRSTVPLLSLLRYGVAVWTNVLEHFGVRDCRVEAHLEFTVPSLQGSGTASHTDVMLIDEDRAVAIEAKWTEPRYDEIGRWVMKGDSLSQQA